MNPVRHTKGSMGVEVTRGRGAEGSAVVKETKVLPFTPKHNFHRVQEALDALSRPPARRLSSGEDRDANLAVDEGHLPASELLETWLQLATHRRALEAEGALKPVQPAATALASAKDLQEALSPYRRGSGLALVVCFVLVFSALMGEPLIHPFLLAFAIVVSGTINLMARIAK